MTLFDLKTPIWLERYLDTPDVRQFLSFHCGSPIAAHPGEAAFAMLSIDEAATRIKNYHVGTPEYPDRATTLLIQTPSLSGGPAVEVIGPGIPDRRIIEATGLGADFWNRRDAINALFPTGLDIVLVDPWRIVGLPRTAQMQR